MYGAYAPQGEFLYDLGSNDDTLNMTVNGGIAADQDFKLLINGNGGNDFINFSFTDLTANQRDNIINGSLKANAGHERVIIEGGSGNDIIKFWGDGSVIVDGGAGNDAIYVGQNAAPNGNGVVLYNLSSGAADALERAIEVDSVNGAQPLNNDLLGVGTSVFNSAASVTNVNLSVTVTFKGIATTLTIDTSELQGNSITAEFLNEAVAKAIAGNTYLSNLIVAKDGAGHSLMIESLANGFIADPTDITIAFASAGAGTNLTGPELAAINTAYGTNVGMGMLSADAANEFIALQGNDNQAEIYGLTLAGAPVATDVYTIRIGDEVYTTAAVGGTTDAALVAALNAATDGKGNLFSAKYTAFDVANTDYTVGAAADDQAISIRYNNSGNQVDVNVSLEKVAALEADGTSSGTVGNTNGADVYGTTSLNVVNAGAGNDTIVLNTTSNANAFDVLVLEGGNFGNDVVVNFQTTIDKIDVSAFMNANVAAGTFTTANITTQANYAVMGTATASAADGSYTWADYQLILGGTTVVANSKGLVFNWNATLDRYDVLSVVSTDTTVTDGEVTVVGSIDTAGAAAAGIVAGDLVITY